MPFSSSICLGEGLPFSFVLARSSSTWDELEPRAIGLEERVEVLGPLAGERRPPGVRIGPRSLDVDHARV